MIDAYIDSNVLIRFLTKDHAEMAERARQSLAAAAAGDIQLVLTPVVLAEVVWTLTSFHGYERRQIADDLLSLVGSQGLEVLDRDVVTTALSLFGDGSVPFGDALVAAYAFVKGPRQICTLTGTFGTLQG